MSIYKNLGKEGYRKTLEILYKAFTKNGMDAINGVHAVKAEMLTSMSDVVKIYNIKYQTELYYKFIERLSKTSISAICAHGDDYYYRHKDNKINKRSCYSYAIVSAYNKNLTEQNRWDSDLIFKKMKVKA